MYYCSVVYAALKQFSKKASNGIITLLLLHRSMVNVHTYNYVVIIAIVYTIQTVHAIVCTPCNV